MVERPVSLGARVLLAHACLQVLANRCGADVLHVKGPALDPALRHPGRGAGTDADVVVRPSHLDRLAPTLAAHGWALVTGFDSGSVFGHAANYRHRSYGYVDLHRWVPGIGLDADAAFDLLWAERGATVLAQVECAVPAVVDQALVLLLHAARGQGSADSLADHDAAWGDLDEETRAAVRARAGRLRATVGLAAALGELDQHPHDRTVPLWRFYSQGGSRLDEYLASIRAAPTWRRRARTAARGLRLNREYVAMELGRPPSRAELRALRRDRRHRALASVRDRLRR